MKINFIKNIDMPKSTAKVNKHTNTLERTPSTDCVNFTGSGAKIQSEFINKFLKSKTFDGILSEFNFAKYEDYGIPLKYSRRRFVREVNEILEPLPQQKQDDLLNKFGLYRGPKDLEGVPAIPEKPENTKEFSKIAECVKNLTCNNEMATKHHRIKPVMNTIIQGFPEFTSIIGKKQHGTHIYSVDIHSLKLLQSAINNPKYAKLSPDGQEVLKFTTLLHDFGKLGGVITPGHAAQSKFYAENILKNIPVRDDIKERILLHVANHHWFEHYNTGIYSAQDVCNIFKTKEDLEIAKILAKGDFENVNPNFHLYRMVGGKEITQEEFDKIFANTINKIQIK